MQEMRITEWRTEIPVRIVTLTLRVLWICIRVIFSYACVYRKGRRGRALDQGECGKGDSAEEEEGCGRGGNEGCTVLCRSSASCRWLRDVE